MSTRRTPPKAKASTLLPINNQTIYGSDPQLSKSQLEAEDIPDFVARRTKRKLVDGKETEADSSLQQIKEILSSQESNNNAKFEKLFTFMMDIKDQNADIQKSLDFFSSKYDDIQENMLKLEQKNKVYELKISELENKVEQLERNSRASAIEIRNIPKQPSENKASLRNMVKQIANVIDQPVLDYDIQDIYRLRTKKESSNHIVVSFTTTTTKDGFIKQCRNFNKANIDSKLNTTHLKELPGPPRPIFIDESLTSLGRKLSFLARQYVKDNHYHSTWNSYGKIFIRKTQESPAIRIDSEEDLKKLVPK
jgi:hypothetical protein